jgi:4-hydroxy-tetrahydrodipicolinate synthase
MKNLKGVFTALVTPFEKSRIDFDSLDKLINQQVSGEVDGFVINGTTAESPTLTKSEQEETFKHVRKKLGSSKTLIFGTGSNCTQQTIESSIRAQELGADALLVVVPYYNKPPQRGLVEHFKKVANSVDLPVLLYNVPSRTVVGLSAESVSELSRVSNIVGIKEATGDIGFMKEIKRLTTEDFIFLSGDDGTYIDFLKAGGHGVISVTSHLFPLAMKTWLEQVSRGQAKEAMHDFEKYKKITELLFIEPNPIPVKAALQMMGLLKNDELRLPLMTLEERWRAPLRDELKKLKLLN